MMTVAQFAKYKNVSRQRINVLIKQGRIPAATQKYGGIWMVPPNAKIIPPNLLTPRNS